MKKQFRDFESAREYVRKLGLKNSKEWREYRKSGNKPDDIPPAPEYTYKNKGWKGYEDWLGNEWRDFKEARKFVRSLGLKGHVEWQDYYKSGDKPDDIPSSPNRSYKKEWEGWGDFLGTGTIAFKDRQWRPFKEAREFARSLGLQGSIEWKKYCKSGDKPDDMPIQPKGVYKNEWEGFVDWLGTEYRPYKEAREFVRKLGLKSLKEWNEYCTSGNKPDDIPSNPWRTYKEWEKK